MYYSERNLFQCQTLFDSVITTIYRIYVLYACSNRDLADYLNLNDRLDPWPIYIDNTTKK